MNAQAQTAEQVFVPEIQKIEGRAFTSSLKVAEFFGRQHKHVLEAIQNVLAETPEIFGETNFRLSEYEVEGQTKKYPFYNLTRDAFTLVAMGFTGKKALSWKIRYIEAFNAMEELIRRENARAPLQSLTPSKKEDRTPLRDQIIRWVAASNKAGQTLQYPQAWKTVTAHFGIPRIAALPREWVGAAVDFVKSEIAKVSNEEQPAQTTLVEPAQLPEPMRLPEPCRSLQRVEDCYNEMQSAVEALREQDFCVSYSWSQVDLRPILRVTKGLVVDPARKTRRQ